MNHYEEIKSLSKISFNFRKNKKPKARWPVEFQLRVLKLIENGYSPQALSQKLEIPVQTYYHWRRVWKNTPKKNLNFIEVPISDKLEDSPPERKQVHLKIESCCTKFGGMELNDAKKLRGQASAQPPEISYFL